MFLSLGVTVGCGKLLLLRLCPLESGPKPNDWQSNTSWSPFIPFRTSLKVYLSFRGPRKVDWNLFCNCPRGLASPSAPSCLLHFPTGISLDSNLFSPPSTSRKIPCLHLFSSESVSRESSFLLPKQDYKQCWKPGEETAEARLWFISVYYNYISLHMTCLWPSSSSCLFTLIIFLFLYRISPKCQSDNWVKGMVKRDSSTALGWSMRKLFQQKKGINCMI